MITIANPIYDAAFKFLMEDQKVAKILLSALLKKEIIELESRPHEYSSLGQSPISLLRIDFSALVRNEDGTENRLLIELHKGWLMTDPLRFWQYRSRQCLDKENATKEKSKKTDSGVSIVSIYMLGHKLGKVAEPVIYDRQQCLDYDGHVLSGLNPFESPIHDNIIVQIPYLKGRARNPLELILNVFDQDYYLLGSSHFLEVDEERFSKEAQCLLHRLQKAAVTPLIRRDMEIEDEIRSLQ